MSFGVRILVSVMFAAIGMTACHKQDAVQDTLGPKTSQGADPFEGKAHANVLMGLWRLNDSPLDTKQSTCEACEPVLKDHVTLRFSINEAGPPFLTGLSFVRMPLQRSDEGLTAAADCAGVGMRERILVEPGPTGVDAYLTRDFDARKVCQGAFQAQCSCVYTLGVEKISDFADAGEPAAPALAPVRKP